MAMHAVDSAYHHLVHELELSRGARLDAAIRARIAVAAQDFQNALKRDGGARDDLKFDVRNIIVSLGDGTFSADGSIRAVRRDAKGSVIDVGAWNPSFLGGAPISGEVGANLSQAGAGDCVGVSVVKAFSNTQAGAAILRRAVTRNADGSYNVSLPGDPSRVHHLGPDNLERYGKGDPAAAAVIGAFYLYFQLDPKRAALPTNKVMALLAGNLGDHDRLADADATPRSITGFLMANASRIGSSVAMVSGGKPDRDGSWSKGDGHAFAVIHIDAPSGMLTYTNPWNQKQTWTIAITELARQAAGTSADFEIVTFR